MSTLTNEEFQLCAIKVKHKYQILEAARLVLVQSISSKSAAVITGLMGKNDYLKVDEAVKEYLEVHAQLLKEAKAKGSIDRTPDNRLAA